MVKLCPGTNAISPHFPARGSLPILIEIVMELYSKATDPHAEVATNTNMTTIIVETAIKAPIEICFDLARDIGVHCQTSISTQERAIAGVTTGLIGLGEEVTFEGVHFGVRQRLTARVTEFDRPHRFVDEMLKGAFQSLRHIHEFSSLSSGTMMKDTLIWTSPLGLLGKLADKMFLEAHMRQFLMERNALLKQIVEDAANAAPPALI